MEMIDQIGNKLELIKIPTKIISLVPSQTEFLFDIGLENELVGITNYCIHPKDKIIHKTKVGGTKNCRIDIIESLNPDIIIANKEENTQADIELLSKKYPVYTSDIKVLEDAYQMMKDLGAIFNKTSQSNTLISNIRENFTKLQIKEKHHAVYFIWRKPWMSIGSDTFIHALMNELGFENMMAHKSRYPEMNLDELKELNPPYILLSSEPFPFKQRHIDELQEICPTSKILLVDGEMFSWYGSRLQYIYPYYENILRKNLLVRN